MKKNLYLNRSKLAGAVLASLYALNIATALAAPPRGNKKDIPTEVTFHLDHTDFAGDPTGVANGITDDGSPYVSSNAVSTGVGRNRNAWVIFSNVGRTLNIDLGAPLGCEQSVGVDLVQDFFDGTDVAILANAPDGTCDYCYHDPGNPSALRPQPPTGSFAAVDPTFTIVMGEDLDDLTDGCVVETNARLDFTDSAGNEWRLTWGPRQVPGGWVPDPRSDPIRMLRTNSALVGGTPVAGNYWFFQTTGDHRAALYRRENPQAGNYFEYYGQFTIPYSGVAEALTYNQNLIGNHCGLTIANIGSGLLPPAVSLAHDGGNILTATAIDHCDDFSTAPDSFDWYVDGNLIPDVTGNIFDLTPYSNASITVFATHPEWLAMLPSLETIFQFDVQGSASFSQGTGGGNAMTVDALAWSFPRKGKDIKVVITIAESVSGAPLSGASVAASLNGPGGELVTIDAATNSNGQVSAKYRTAASGVWFVTIDDVTHGSFTWDGAQPSPNWVTKN